VIVYFVGGGFFFAVLWCRRAEYFFPPLDPTVALAFLIPKRELVVGKVNLTKRL